jgi:hypothetical protein
MRFGRFFFLLMILAGVSSAQEFTFSSGPGYLLPTNSTMLLRPIATPTLTLDAPLPPVSSLPEIGPPVSDQPYVSNYNPMQGPDLFPIYYGYPRIPVVEVVPTETRRVIPVSLGDVVFTVSIGSQPIRGHGDGNTVGEAASFWKARRRRATHVYTNADIQRLRPS